jgi:putative peptide maturation system protein
MLTTADTLEQVLRFLRARRPGLLEPRQILAEFQRELCELGDRIELLWEGNVQRGHDLSVLIHGEDGTTSVAWSPRGDVPWAIRGTQRWSEGWVARLDGREISVGDLMSALEFVWGELRIGRHLLRMRVIQTELARRPLEVDETDVEEQRRDFMREQGLSDDAAIEAWLRERRITRVSLREQWHERAIQRAFRRRVVASSMRAKDWPDAPSRLRVLRVPFETREAAAAVAARGNGEPASVLAASFSYLESGGSLEALVLDVEHGDLADDVWKTLSSLPESSCLAASTNDGWCVFQRLRRDASQSAVQAEEERETRIFEAWLDEKIAASTIEWFWGPQSGRALGD